MSSVALNAYIAELQRELKQKEAREHAYRPALKKLLEALGDFHAVNDAAHIKDVGAPDFIIKNRENLHVAFVEAKDVGDDLNRTERSEQIKGRYLPALPNLVLTDYIEFRWYYKGEKRQSARLGRLDGTRLTLDPQGTQDVWALLNSFAQHTIPTVHSAEELARAMAGMTRHIARLIEARLPDSKQLQDEKTAFEQTLIPDLDTRQFADMYAQTLAYGLFAARLGHNGKAERFTLQNAFWELPATNPFLKHFFQHIAPNLEEPVRWQVDVLADLLGHADIGTILAGFGRKTRQEDPIVHFYETFLAAYDPALRESRGVYYTPEPVVSYIVRSVDHILREKFGRYDGLADKDVYVLDPATGTGTFLYFVIQQIFERVVVQNRQGGQWGQYVEENLLKRIFGFELLMAPYAVAHMKLGLQLQDLMKQAQPPSNSPQTWGEDRARGAMFEERLGIYLTNTLEELHPENQPNLPLAGFITEEGQKAAEIKRNTPIMVVLGNPPYSGHSANRSAWIGNLVRDYYSVDGQPLGERNPKWLQDDYVKFIRFGQWRINQTGSGVLAFVTNNGFLDNPTFRGMRQQLMQTFSDIYILDLHGNSRKRETAPDGSVDENVFDIMQGVSIGIFVKERTSPLNPLSTRGEGTFAAPTGSHQSNEFSARPASPPLHVGSSASTPPLHRMERGPGGEVAQRRLIHQGAMRIDPETGEVYLRKAAPELWAKLKVVAREMRRNPTPAEELLWQHLRNRQLEGKKFRRQHAIERFIVDFYCAEADLVIEVDGPIHQYTPEEDAARQEYLEIQGLTVLRFSNDEVLNAPGRVLQRIRAALVPHPKPLATCGEGLSSDPLAVSASSQPLRGEGLSTGTSGTSTPPLHAMERGPGGEVRPPARVHHIDLWGIREDKYTTLLEYTLGTTPWKTLRPQAPYYLFAPQDQALFTEYQAGYKVTEIMPVNVLGFQSHRDHFAIDFDRAALHERIKAMRDTRLSDDEFSNRYEVTDNRDWQLSRARAELRQNAAWERDLIDCLYRPFDWRPCYFSEVAMDYPRRELMDHVAGQDNICMNVVRQTKAASWQHALVSNAPTPAVYVEVKDGSSVFPLYLYPSMQSENGQHGLFDTSVAAQDWPLSEKGRRPNLSKAFVEDLAGRLGLAFVTEGVGDLQTTFGPEDVFHYAYAVFHSPTYRERYAEFLKIDFPRLPLTSDVGLFKVLCGHGATLVKLHLMDRSAIGDLITAFPVGGNNVVEKGYPVYTAPSQPPPNMGEGLAGRVAINKTQYFEGVPPEVWEFHVGSYQVLEKWLKDRRGRALSYEDTQHYQQIVVALQKTMGLMRAIDAAIPVWPIE